MQTYAVKGEEIILVTPENKDSLTGYEFRELTEVEELEYKGFLVEIVEGEIIATPTDESKKYEIKEKLDRMDWLKAKVISKGGNTNGMSNPKLDSANALKISEWKQEYDDLEEEIGSYESSLVDDVISAFF